ncbi:MAG TPA: flavodoxin domain-containing protein [Kineosporiaceae bacterium]|nr:flavodoxin domain-containing protein [Kineosporiaceae bacterium]
MRVLVAVASRHGSTLELAQAMGQALRAHGVEPEIRQVGEVPVAGSGSVEDFDGVVLGSALYVQRWLEPAVRFAQDRADDLRSRPVWLFSSGAVGHEALHQGPEELADLERLTGAREHRIFPGRLDENDLDADERRVVDELGVAGGDYRDWAAVRAWAARVADTLTAGT